MTTERLHPDGDFDSAEDAAAFRRRVYPSHSDRKENQCE